uniref:EamA domain-containing protein n=1 Tax=Meloidogyne hapla TaxID=6305 RepID=A0A1I8BNQ2_MELHA
MMWFNNCCLIICFPLFLFYEKLIKKNQLSLREITSKSARIFSDEGFRFGPFFLKEIFFLCLYAFGNYSYALSLGKISSSAALTIRSFEVSVVYIFGRLVLKDNFNIFKTIAVFLAMIGVLLIALDKEFAANIIGFILVTFKLVSGDEASLGEGMLFLSGMALVNLPLNFLPTALLVHFGYDIWQWNYIPWGNFLNFVFLTFVFNIATIFGVAALGPLSIVIGILCGIPISICIDVILRGRHLTPIFVIGALSLVISAILANFHKQIGDLIKPENEENKENVQDV